MSARRLRVGVLFGGRSSEHEVSLMSARAVLGALDPQKYDIIPIGVTKQGAWLIAPDAVEQLIDRAASSGALEGEVEGTAMVALTTNPSRSGELVHQAAAGEPAEGAFGAPLDVLFPLIHGRTGEDGVLQGVFELAEVPFVGAGVLGSAVGMDKAITKKLWQASGLPVGPYIVVTSHDWKADSSRWKGEIATKLGFPCFVKPANSGSSIGITKVHRLEDLESAVLEATTFDNKLIIESSIAGRELECGVLGNESPEGSIVGEIIPGHEFYDYEDKYFDDAVQLVIPAELPAEVAQRVQQLAVKAFLAVEARGMARVDFFLEDETGELYVNEINTIPGFTRMSMFPRLWEASGLDFPDLCDRLISLALERHEQRAVLKQTR